MADSFPFDTSGAIDFFGTLRSFGKHYTRVESLEETSSSVAFTIDPITKVSLTANLSTGKYILFASYGFEIDKTNREIIVAIELNGVEIQGREEVSAREVLNREYTTRILEFDVIKDTHTVELLFGISAGPAIATMFDASLTIWKIK